MRRGTRLTATRGREGRGCDSEDEEGEKLHGSGLGV